MKARNYFGFTAGTITFLFCLISVAITLGLGENMLSEFMIYTYILGIVSFCLAAFCYHDEFGEFDRIKREREEYLRNQMEER